MFRETDLAVLLEKTLKDLEEIVVGDTRGIIADVKSAIVVERIRTIALGSRGLDPNEKRAENLRQEEIEMYSYWNHRDDRS